MGAFAGAGAGRRFAPYKRFPEGKTLMPGEFSSPEQMKETLGGAPCGQPHGGRRARILRS